MKTLLLKESTLEMKLEHYLERICRSVYSYSFMVWTINFVYDNIITAICSVFHYVLLGYFPTLLLIPTDA